MNERIIVTRGSQSQCQSVLLVLGPKSPKTDEVPKHIESPDIQALKFKKAFVYDLSVTLSMCMIALSKGQLYDPCR